MYAREGDGRESLFELKRLAECLMDGAEARLATTRPFEHPERAAIMAWRGEDVGRLFELHPELGIEGRAAILDLDFTKMEKLGLQEARRYQPWSRFPVSAFDLSVVAGLREPSADIERRLASAAGSDLVEIEFLREYIGAPPLPQDRKSVTYRLTVGAVDRTLSSEEVGAIRERVMAAVRKLPD
jgi:phenylalanyl-tRNA synthetase beta chain